jgi:hypothetical protein
MRKYLFITALYEEYSNPFQALTIPTPVAPANPPASISPATLGYFSAHTTQTLTLVVK